ncbi:MAG: ACP S-malonyltransferase [Candidatus Melainabacteria bacterium]|nr:ACP S-malonyltransferase [Candidatus Melainabacteria bacterium]
MYFAVLFPGQGSQKAGMGLDLYEHTEIAKDIFNKVNLQANRNISNVFLYGPQEELNQTKNTQISIVAVSVALTLLLTEELKKRSLPFKPYAACGHSLGELTALWFANFITLEDLIKLVLVRGNLMQNAPGGKMAAILNLTSEKIEKEILDKNNLVIANYNSPTQLVISGKKEAFENIEEKVKLLGGKTIILPVSGAFHSSLMEDSSKKFVLEIDKLLELPVNNQTVPVFQNIDGLSNKDFKSIKEKLKRQMISPVLWTQTINNLVNENVRAVIEIGPGKILTGLVKKINPGIDCYNVNDLNSLQEFINIYELKLLKHQS